MIACRVNDKRSPHARDVKNATTAGRATNKTSIVYSSARLFEMPLNTFFEATAMFLVSFFSSFNIVFLISTTNYVEAELE